jgi:hypothetical protein
VATCVGVLSEMGSCLLRLEGGEVGGGKRLFCFDTLEQSGLKHNM